MRIGVCIGAALLTAAPLSAQEATAPFDLAKLPEDQATDAPPTALDGSSDCDAAETNDDAIVVCGKRAGEAEFETTSQLYDKGNWAEAEPAKANPLETANHTCTVGIGGCLGRLPVRWVAIPGGSIGKIDAETEALIRRQAPIR